MNNPLKNLDDNSLMPDNGQHKHKTKMGNISARDLLWLYDNKKCSPRVRLYISDNLEDLMAEVNR